MSRVFINYRRGDTAAHALYEQLSEHYGEDQVCIAVVIEPGDEWSQVIDRAIAASDIVLAVIGSTWLSELARRTDVEDFVRFELETALRRDVRILPVLVEGARMPAAHELPASLARLTRRQPFELGDTQELLEVIDRALSIDGTEPQGTMGAGGFEPP